MPQTADDFLDSPASTDLPADRLSDSDLSAIVQTVPPITIKSITSALSPMTQQAATDAINKSQSPSTSVSGVTTITARDAVGSRESLYQAAKRPGIPLELDSKGFGSVDPWIRFQTSRRDSLQEQLDYLNTKLGPGKARIPPGQKDIVVTIPDPENPGQEKDVLLNEKNLTINDVVALGKHAPAAAGAIVGMLAPELLAAKFPSLAMKVPAMVKTLATVLGGATGQKAGEAASKIEQKAEMDQPLEIGSTLKQEAIQIPTQAAMDFATLGAFKFLNLAQKAIRGAPGFWNTPVQLEGNAANIRLAQTLGTEPIRMTPGQASGNPLAIFLEAYSRAKPQARALWDEFNMGQAADKQAIGRAMTSMSGTDEQVGQDLMNVLQQTAAQKQAALDSIREKMTGTEAMNLDKAIGKAVPMPNEFKPSEAGGQFREAFQELFSKVKEKVANAYNIPGIKTPDIPTDQLAAGLATLNKQAEGIPGLSGVLALDLPEKASYDQLKNIRSMLWQRIEDSPADRSVKDFYGGRVSNQITGLIEDAAKNVRDPGFKKAITEANRVYREEQLPFHQAEIGDLLRKEGLPGSPDNLEILNRFTSNTDLYRRLVDVAGPKSAPVNIVRQSLVDGLLTKSGTQAIDSEFVNAGNLVKNLQSLKSNPKTREMFDDVFGANGDRIINQARIMGSVQGTLPREEAEKLLTGNISKSTSAKNLQTLLDKEDALARDYTTAVLKGEPLDPQKFVDRVMNVATPTQLKQIKSEVIDKDPTLLPMIQDKVIENILGRVNKLDKSSLDAVIDSPAMRDKYRLILEDKYSNVKDFASVLGNIEFAEKAAEGTGMLVKGQSIGELAGIFRPRTTGRGPGVLGRAAEAVPSWIGWKMLTRAILSGPVRSWASKVTPGDIPELAKAAVLSEPVLEELGGKPAHIIKSHVMDALHYLRMSGSSTAEPSGPSQPQARPGITADQFLNQ